MPESSIQVNVDAAQAAAANEAEESVLREHAVRAARSCAWLPHKRRSGRPREIFRNSTMRFFRVERQLYQLRSGEPSEDLKVLYESVRLVRTGIQDLEDGTKLLSKLPAVRTAKEESIPRAVVLARALLAATQNRLSESAFSSFLEAVQEVEPLRLAELWGMLPALKLVLLERIAETASKALEAFRASGADAAPFEIGRMITSLRLIGDLDWNERIEQLSFVHRILCLDPIGAYPRMDFESREFYRRTLERIATQSDVTEIELARRAVQMAKEASIPESAPDALRQRMRHVGYYLVDDLGSQDLRHQIAYRPSFVSSVQQLFRSYPDEIYIIGIEFVTLITVVTLLMRLVRTTNGGFGLIVGALLLIIPATHAAVELMNYLVAAVLTPRLLPKLDFSRGVDASCATMVAIPTLLLNDRQIAQLVDDLEVRYLVNRDPNIFYALLTDLPDTAEPVGEQDHRVDVAVRLIEELNRKHADEPYGGFYLFHRHRVYNPREGAWMGWERKRGKLLDLNKLLRRVYDPFPIKAGDMSRLPPIKYVLTLDSDTQLPRGSAQRLIGAMAHPLNRPLIDPELNIVTQGYGIFQPRVGISVHSATRSRLATIYSGATGFDVYARAVSDVYQDLYGEGIFTGKGIYDVDALRQVLEHRFPHNTLLSHDLIEGAYARAGLVSDVEVIDDYPSHYSAYNRRRHRWLRGDWQIARWTFNHVPDESRHLVNNPISLVSKWKIVDNLRRSLVEPATFLLLFAGWFFLPGGPRFWTILTLALLFLPIYFRLLFSLLDAASKKKKLDAQEALADFGTAHISILLSIAFLAHQTLVALDAIIRTVIRSTVTHSRLLEWETATEAELGIKKRTPVDIYLDWMPLVAICLALTVFLRPEAAPYALPFIAAWGCSKLISSWINRSPHAEDSELTAQEHRFLRDIALRTWRYFADFSNENNNWLIPDNVQDNPRKVDERLSPTNLGFLINARQAALEFGYLTVLEFVAQTEGTLQSVLKLPRHFGHIVNWHDNITLNPLDPQFVSSVDSGNLVASLWALKQHCLELLHEPVMRQSALEGLVDHCRICGDKRDRTLDEFNRLRRFGDPTAWLPRLFEMPNNQLGVDQESETKEGLSWRGALTSRVEALREQARRFSPWQLPEFAPIRNLPARDFQMPSVSLAPANGDVFYQQLEERLRALISRPGVEPDIQALAARLGEEIAGCRGALNDLSRRLKGLAMQADRLVRDVNFEMLVDSRRTLLSVGYDVAGKQLNKACYDLLASESRTATFIAVAKGQALQDTWFRLGRQHTSCEGESVLISWTGTMFEYLMPVIWMKSHPNTLLDRSVRSAVRAQRLYGKSQGVPWGISEAAYGKDPDGNYQYGAFGVPCLALNVARTGPLVISPYSSCLALLVDPGPAVENLRRMAAKKWVSEYGFYESADFTKSPSRAFLPRKYELIRCWMAHHQGMALAALCNVLYDSAFQRWFHAEPIVQASELILQERPLRTRPIADILPRRVLPFTRSSAKGPTAKVKVPA